MDMTSRMYFVTAIMISFSFQVESKKSKSKRQKSKSTNTNDTMQYLFIGSVVLLLLGILVYLIKRRQQLLRAQKLRSIKHVLEVKQLSRKDRACTMTQMQKDETISWFMKQNWVLEQSSGKDHTITTTLKIVSLKRKQIPIDGQKYLKDYYDAFYVEMQGSYSVIFGVIMFEKYYMTILFDKSTSNNKNINGTYDYKLFDGCLKKGTFEGKWWLTNDSKIQAQKESHSQKEIDKSLNESSFSQRSIPKSHKQIDENLSHSQNHKKTKGTFKLYHV